MPRKAQGKPPLLTSKQRAALAQVIEDGPLSSIDGVVRWRLVDLVSRHRGFDGLIVGGIEARQMVSVDHHPDTAGHAGPA